MKVPNNTKFEISSEKFTVNHEDEKFYRIIREDSDFIIPISDLEGVLVQKGLDLENLKVDEDGVVRA